MNSLTILSVLFAFCCVVNGYSNQASGSTSKLTPTNCAASVSAFPPDPKSECCGLNGPGTNRLDGGTIAKINEYPWLVLLEFLKNGVMKTLCGGALISGKYVLTAAHCVTEQAIRVAGQPVNIRLGEHDTSNEGPDCIEYAGDKECTAGITRIPIEKTIPHPEYSPSPNHKNDIALIRMIESAPYTDSIRPICLPTLDITTITGPISLKKSGWGYFDPKESVSVKQQVTVPFVSQNVCQEAYGSLLKLWKGHICAGGQKVKDFCKGDGGLPLMYANGNTHELTGIVSFGTAVCSDIPTAYTNVYEYKSWINSNITP